MTIGKTIDTESRPMNRIQNWRRWWSAESVTDERAGRRRRGRLRLRPDVMNLEGRQLLATIDVTNASAVGAGSLTNAIAQANGNKQANTIDFSSAVFNTAQRILINGELELSDTSGRQTIEGPTAGVTIVVRVSTTVLTIEPNVKAVLSGLTLTGATGDGGALVNNGTASVSDCTVTGNVFSKGSGVINTGTLTLTASVISDNSATLGGSGGMLNTGTLTATGCTISDNTDTSSTGLTIAGGGLCNTGTATLTRRTINGNSDPNIAGGGGVENAGTMSMATCTVSAKSGAGAGGVENSGFGLATLTDCTLADNSGAQGGGFAMSGLDLTQGDMLVGCTITGNMAKEGGGIYTGNRLTVDNCTIAGNSSTSNLGGGGGVLVAADFVTLNDCTIVDNSSKTAGGGYYNDFGVQTANGCIIADNTAATDPNISGNDKAHDLVGSFNLIGTGGEGGLLAANNNLLNVADPLFGTLGSYGGPTQTIPLLPGSPAIGAGETIAGITTDGRGISRPATDPDIGAFQDQGFSFTITSGGTQTALDGKSFATALGVTVKSLAKVADPVAGGVVSFTVPKSGASASLSTRTATIGSTGVASVTATANHVAGIYVVEATMTGTPAPLDFQLTNASISSTSSPNDIEDQALGAITPAIFGDGTGDGATSKHGLDAVKGF
jgi:hypothetical protein